MLVFPVLRGLPPLSAASDSAAPSSWVNKEITSVVNTSKIPSSIPASRNEIPAGNLIIKDKLWASLKADNSTPIDFNNLVFDKECQHPEFKQKIEKYKSYPYKKVGDYRDAKYNTSTGKDARPVHFDPDGRDTATHGTEFEAVLLSVINCNLQLVPVVKQFKLQGKQPGSGESAKTGTTFLNSERVSTVSLKYMTSNFYAAMDYAQKSTSVFLNKPRNPLNTMPVVVVGDGIGGQQVYSDVSNEVGYKRLNIRIIAFRNEEDKKAGMEWLRKARDELDIAEIDSLRFCTFKELRGCMRDYDLTDPRCDKPDVASLWANSRGL